MNDTFSARLSMDDVTRLQERAWHRWLMLVFVASLCLRLLFVWVQESYHVFDIYFVASDSRLYQTLANSLRSGAGYSFGGHPSALVTPGYPMFLAAFNGLGIESPIAIGFVQCLIGAVTSVLIAMVGRSVGGIPVGVIAGLLAATYVHLIFWTGYVLTETLFVFFVVASLMAVLWWQSDVASLRRAIFAGTLFGMGALVRPHLMVLAVLVSICVIAGARQARRAAIRSGLFLIFAMALVIFPWVLRNYLALGVPIAGSTLSGEVLYQGNSPGATGGTGGYVDARDFRRLDLPRDLNEVEVNRAYSQAAWQFILHEPASQPGLAFRKFVNMWRPTYEGASLRNFLIFGCSYLFVVFFSVLGIVRCLRRRPSNREALLLMGLLFFAGIHLIVPGMIRYRLPAEPFLIVFAAVALHAALTSVRKEPAVLGPP